MRQLAFGSIIAVTLTMVGVALAQAQSGGQVMPTPIGSSDAPKVVTRVVPAAEPSPDTMPGGLYRLGNGYLSCPDPVPMSNGQPNLRACSYVKDLH
jgi:hypothetical protein